MPIFADGFKRVLIEGNDLIKKRRSGPKILVKWVVRVKDAILEDRGYFLSGETITSDRILIKECAIEYLKMVGFRPPPIESIEIVHVEVSLWEGSNET